MNVFVTGATGFIGSAVVRELQEAGHGVLGLARSDASAAELELRDVEVHRGDVTDVESLAAGARSADGVVHTAFIHDFSAYEENTRVDRRAVEALAAALEGTGKPFVATSGTSVLTPGRFGTEDDAPDPASPGSPRARSEAALPFSERGVRTSVIRLPPTVHGRGDTAFIPAVVGIARRTGVSAYVGDGTNRWPAVHRLDAARLFRLALEGAEPGSRLHGVAEEGVPLREVAEAVGAGLRVPTQSVSPDEAADHFGWLGGFLAVDNPTSSAITRERLGWSPQEAGLIADLRGGSYFDEASRTALAV